MKKKDFFHKHSLRSSESFSFKELALETFKYLMDTSRIRSEDDLRRFKESSAFLSDYTTEHDLDALAGTIAPPQSAILTTGDLGRLSQEEYVKKKEQEFLERARKMAEEELEKERRKAMEDMQVQQKRLEELRDSLDSRLEEVKRMESILDGLPSTIDPEDYVSLEEEKEKEQSPPTTWWQKIGLTADPFPTKLGLNRIPENKYEEVVVATKIFNDYLKMIDQAPQSLFGKTILITGQFGAGKTTFIQYISYKLVRHKILPFQLVLDPIGDVDVLRQNFYSEIFALICKSMSRRGFADPRPQGAVLEKSTIADLLSYLTKETKIDGYVVMIDGLHKAESTIETSLEFVKQLQNFHEYLNNYGINICIFVTGSPLWLRKITQNPAYSGSFYRIDEVPTITFEAGYELLQRRIRAFSSSDMPIFFDKSAIGFAYNSVATDLGGDVTFRAFIDYVLPRLERGDFKGAGISVSIDMEDVRKIDRELGSSVIKDSYSHFRQVTKGKSRLRHVCCNILRVVYKSTYYREEDPKFLANKGAFYILRNSNLIQKVKTRGGLGWAISSDFLAVLEDLNEQGYPPAVAFQALSIDPSETVRKDSQIDPVLNAAQNFLAKWESEWPEIIPYMKGFFELHGKVMENCTGAAAMTLCQDCRDALTKLIQCAQIIFDDKQMPEEWLRSTWLDMPILASIISVLLQDSLSETERVEYYQRYHQSATVVLETLGQLLEINRMINLVSSHNGKEEMRTLFSAGNFLQNGDFESAIETINSSIENRLRVAFHLAFSLHFGSEYLKNLPTSAQERISIISNKAPYPLKRSIDHNLFYHLSRSEYAEVVNKKDNWSNFFEKVFSPKSKEEVVQALQMTFALDDRKLHRDRPDYFRTVREQIRQAICNADWLLYSLANVLRLSISPSGFIDETQDDYHKVRISFAGQDQCASSHLWSITTSRTKEIASRLTRISATTVNFSDDMAVSTLFNGALGEIFIVIAKLLREKLIEVHDQPESRMYLLIIPRAK